MAWWVSFESGRPGCVEFPVGMTDAAERVAFAEALPGAEGRKVASVQPLPYPAEPRLNPTDCFTTDGRNIGPCPSFCWRPYECAGRTSCPRAPSCVD